MPGIDAQKLFVYLQHVFIYVLADIPGGKRPLKSRVQYDIIGNGYYFIHPFNYQHVLYIMTYNTFWRFNNFTKILPHIA